MDMIRIDRENQITNPADLGSGWWWYNGYVGKPFTMILQNVLNDEHSVIGTRDTILIANNGDRVGEVLTSDGLVVGYLQSAIDTATPVFEVWEVETSELQNLSDGIPYPDGVRIFIQTDDGTKIPPV